LLIAFFALLFSPIIAGKIVLAIWLIGMPLSYIYFYRSHNPHHTIFQYFPLLFLYNIRFYHGNISFLLSLPILFYLLGYQKRYLYDLKLSKSIFLGIMYILLFAIHFIGFIIGLISLFFTLLIKYRFKIMYYLKYLCITAPSILLLIIYILKQTGDSHAIFFIPHVSLLGKLSSVFATFSIAFRFDHESFSMFLALKLLLNILIWIILIIIIIDFIIDITKKRTVLNEYAIFGLALIGFGLILPTVFFNIIDLDTRLFFIGSLLILPVYKNNRIIKGKTTRTYFMILYSLIVILNSYQIFIKGKQYEYIINNIDMTIGPNKKLLIIMGDFIFEDQVSDSVHALSKPEIIIRRLVPGIGPLMRVPYYYYIKNGLAYPHVFQTAMFKSVNSKLPLLIKPYPTPQQIYENLDEYQYICVVGQPIVIDYFIHFFAGKSKLLFHENNHAIIEIIQNKSNFDQK
jgi:hypothetical protein